MHEHFLIIFEYQFIWSGIKHFYKAEEVSQMSTIADFF